MIIHFTAAKEYDLSRVSSLDQKLIKAIIANDMNGFKSAIDQGANVNTCEGLPVIVAVLHHRDAFVKELYEHEANFAIAAQTLKQTLNDLYRRREDYYKTAHLSTKDIDDLRYAHHPVEEMLEAYRTGLDNIMMRRQANAFNKVAEKVNKIESQFGTLTQLLSPQQIIKKGLSQ